MSAELAMIAENIRNSKEPLACVQAANLRNRFNPVQRAMIAARLVDGTPGSKPITSVRAAALLNIARGSITSARTVLRSGTQQEIEAADGGLLPLHPVAWQIRTGVPPEYRRRERAPPKSNAGRISRIGKSVYERLAEEGPAKRPRRPRPEPATLPSSPPPPPPEPPPNLIETLRALIILSSEYRVDEAADLLGPEARNLDYLITWLLEVHERALKQGGMAA